MTDAVQHTFWKFRDPDHFRGGLWDETEEEWNFSSENIAEFKSFINEVYVKVDSLLGEIVDRLGGNPVVVIVSDHGQKPAKQPLIFVDSYKLLHLAGLMEIDEEGNPDFARSQLYPLNSMTMTNVGALAVNLKGREKNGWIESGAQSERIIEEASKALQSIKVIETGEPFFAYVKGAGDLGDGFESVRNRIDIRLKCNSRAFGENSHLQIGDKVYPASEILEVRGISGTHTNLGIFLISAPRFRTGVLLPALNTLSARAVRSWMNDLKGSMRDILYRGCDLFNLCEEVGTLDLTPTLLYQLGLPVGADMDGKIPIFLVKEDILEENSPTYVKSYDALVVKRPPVEKRENTEDEMDMLRALGYIK